MSDATAVLESFSGSGGLKPALAESGVEGPEPVCPFPSPLTASRSCLSGVWIVMGAGSSIVPLCLGALAVSLFGSPSGSAPLAVGRGRGLETVCPILRYLGTTANIYRNSLCVCFYGVSLSPLIFMRFLVESKSIIGKLIGRGWNTEVA